MWIFPESNWCHAPHLRQLPIRNLWDDQVNHRQANEMVEQIRLSRVGSIFNGVGVKEPRHPRHKPRALQLGEGHGFRPGILGPAWVIYIICVYI